MRKKIVVSFAAAVGMMAASALSFAQGIPARPEKPASGAESTAAKRAIGEVVAVDAKAGKLTVKTAQEELNLSIQAAARKSLESIKVGDKVNVSYRDQGGMLVAEAVSKTAGADGATKSKTSTGAPQR